MSLRGLARPVARRLTPVARAVLLAAVWRVVGDMSLFGTKTGRAAPEDRRTETRRIANARGIVTAPGVETACVIADLSGGGMKLRLDRGSALPREVTVIDVAGGAAYAAVVVWQKGQEAGLKQTGAQSLRGLVPARLAAARDAWLRAGGR